MTNQKHIKECKESAMEFYKPLPPQFDLEGKEIKNDFFKTAIQVYGGQQEQKS